MPDLQFESYPSPAESNRIGCWKLVLKKKLSENVFKNFKI